MTWCHNVWCHNIMLWRYVRRGWMVKVLSFRTEGSGFESHHAPEVGHHLLLVWWKSGRLECYPTRKDTGVYANVHVMLHIKEHVWTIRTCSATMLLPVCRIVGGEIRHLQKQCTFPQDVLLKQKCGYSCYVTCNLPRELIRE